MDRGSRSELLKTIESQQEKIQKYETKLRDLIMAYKGVIKEKEALEASISALSTQTPISTPRSSRAQPREGDDQTEDDEQEHSEINLNDSEEDAHNTEVAQLRHRLTTLSTSLATLTQEKSKLEANFLADKKKIRQEYEEKCEELDQEKHRSNNLREQLTQDITEWKNKLRKQQHEREKEHHDHAIMLRELQKLLADEREAKELLEHQIDELKHNLVETSQCSDKTSDHYEKMIQDLREESEAVRGLLRASEERSLQPSPAFLQLQQDLQGIKTQHDLYLQREELRSSETEQMMHSNTKDSEDRVASLEAKISELSEVVGNYERLRNQDQQTIQKLKDRVCQLDIENTTLAQSTKKKGLFEQEFASLEGSADIQAIVDKMVRLKDLLKTANETSDKPVDIDELLQGGLGMLDQDMLHQRCQEDYDQLKEEFERYKLRAQSVLKSKSSKDSSPHAEVDILKTQVSELKERLYSLRADYEEQSATLKTREENFHKTLVGLHEKHAEEFNTQKADYKHRMGELELEIRRHRERTIALLAEKDREVESLRRRLPDHLETQYITTYRQMSQGSDPGEIGASSEEGAAVSELLTRTSVHAGNPGETTLLHFAQEQARKEVEIQNLRKQKHGLEVGMRELQQSSILKEQRYLEQIDLLKEEIRKYERNQSRESANLEYLKNVVYHFMVCTDKLGKQGTLNAISMILQFSPREKKKVQQELDRGWWNYVNSQTQKTRI